MFDVILEDLKRRFGDKIFLTPDDLALITGISIGQQAKLRSENRFPIPYEKIGNRIKISIYHLAEYLSKKANAYAKKKVKEEVRNLADKRKESKKATNGRLKKDWFRDFMSTFVVQYENRLMLSSSSNKEPKVLKKL